MRSSQLSTEQARRLKDQTAVRLRWLNRESDSPQHESSRPNGNVIAKDLRGDRVDQAVADALVNLKPATK